MYLKKTIAVVVPAYNEEKLTIAVVVPAYNEEKLIARTLKEIPDLVDKMIVVDDASTDSTARIVTELAENDQRIQLIQHEGNQGVGGAIVTGYKKARDLGIDVTVVMAGDAQMDPNDLIRIIEPVANGRADYTKGNRLFYGDAWNMIPHYRYLGKSFLSLIALQRVNLDKIYKRYGMPNDLLIKLNQHDFRVRDVHVRPVYNVGEKSGIKLIQVIPKISWSLFKGCWQRLVFKYVIKDFHPLIFFFLLSFVLLGASVPLTIRLFYVWAVTGNIPDINAMALVFTAISGLQTLFFGMWFDMDYNKNLK
jgi:glycosyltransferase involved in cell wall biosynthesis